MLFVLLMAGAIVNSIFCAIAGAVVVVGIVFYLIGIPQNRSSDRTQNMIKESVPIFLTLLFIIVYMVIAYWCAKTGGTLAFARTILFDQAKKLFYFGALQGVYSLLVLKWILPALMGELGLGRKHKLGISAGVILTLAGGGAAWLTAM